MELPVWVFTVLFATNAVSLSVGPICGVANRWSKVVAGYETEPHEYP